MGGRLFVALALFAVQRYFGLGPQSKTCFWKRCNQGIRDSTLHQPVGIIRENLFHTFLGNLYFFTESFIRITSGISREVTWAEEPVNPAKPMFGNPLTPDSECRRSNSAVEKYLTRSGNNWASLVSDPSGMMAPDQIARVVRHELEPTVLKLGSLTRFRETLFQDVVKLNSL